MNCNRLQKGAETEQPLSSATAHMMADLLQEIKVWLTEARNVRPWTEKEVGTYLGVTVRTVRNWTSRRRIPHVKLANGQVRFLKDDIDRWIKKHAVKPETRG